jgi:C_GCAxxG_C_C family probable redox protein
MTKPEQAVRLHASGSNCAQSVLCAFTSELGMDTAMAHRLATGLGAGLGRRQHLCGAVNGGAMALAQPWAMNPVPTLQPRNAPTRLVQAYIKTMEAEFGSIDCRTLLGVDLNTPEGKAELKERGLSAKVCDKLIARCAEEVDRILKSQG